MYYTDYHAHSHLSLDGEVPLCQMAEAAVQAGISELCITDHYDTLTGQGDRAPVQVWDDWLAQFVHTQAQFRGKLVLKFGIEFGSGHLDDTAVKTAPPELDFVIGSIHNRNEASGGLDFYYLNYTDHETCYQALDNYMSSLEMLAPLDCYDVLGHIIYPLRYMKNRDGQDVSMERYMDRIRGLMQAAVQAGRGIEVNTYTGRTLAEWMPVLKLYREVGGEIITTGADAHAPANVGKGIAQAHELLQTCGFRYVTTFQQRKPRFLKL